jgi:pyruvate kinase
MRHDHKKTKIVCTIGPASDTYSILVKMIDAGMDVMRINFSHGNYDTHLEKINLSRRLEKEKGIYIPVMLDTRGPEIRTGFFENDEALIKEDSVIRISMTPIKGTHEHFSVSYPYLFEDVKIGDSLKIDDGNLTLKIIDKDNVNRELIVIALNSHVITNRKGVNAPFARLSMPFISQRDKEDIEFGVKHNVDYIAASFTRRKQDILDIKQLLTEFGSPNIPIIAKIENPEGVTNLKEIVEVADGIMVARGDLGVEIPAEKVPIIQKQIISLCRKVGKPVITATQMLDSMVNNPRPTRAEVSDVANAIYEGSDAVMLSAESASGKYPVEAVKMMHRIALTMEKELDYTKLSAEAYQTSLKDNSDAIANSVANTAALIEAELIVCYTETGRSVKRIAKARPFCPIVAISDCRETVMRLGLYWGIQATYSFKLPQLIEDMEVMAILKARRLNYEPGTQIILTGGTPTGSGKTNFMKILKLKPLQEIAL